jgi:(1->4)-alpha-D-glucan 1-alpha-D-glucosylmutase
MVMAKGVEDTAFYRVSRLASLTEVGGDPDEFSLGVDEFHARQQSRLAALPGSMTVLSTHDTKRGEDTRARISALAEIPHEWAAFVSRRRSVLSLGDGPFENLLWESIVGAWPREREALQAYAEKAAREAGNSTDWLDPDAGFEEKLAAAVDAAFDNARVRAELDSLVELLAPYGAVNSLGAKLVQLTMPGVPDVYQGTEFWDRSLTDPDNRRPFDYGARRAALAALDAGDRPASYTDDAAKLLVTSRALRLRRDRPELFTGYRPVTATGSAAGHLVGFDRCSAAGAGAVTLATRLPRGLEQQGGWRDTAIHLDASMTDELTGATFGPGTVEVATILASYPVALLVPAKH